MFVKTGLVLAFVCASLAAPNTAKAAIYKCLGSDGEVSYNQTACPVEAEIAKLINTDSTSKANYDCRIANNFARKTALTMRSGQSSGDLFLSYGGIDAIPRTAIGVINYVYTHIGNIDTKASRVAALSAARCSAGSYGPVDCDDFPYDFIAELGGCEMAKKSMLSHSKSTTPVDSNLTEQNASTQAMGVRTSADAGISSDDCKSSVQTQLNELFTQMREGQSANSQSMLQAQKKQLNTQLSGC